MSIPKKYCIECGSRLLSRVTHKKVFDMYLMTLLKMYCPVDLSHPTVKFQLLREGLHGTTKWWIQLDPKIGFITTESYITENTFEKFKKAGLVWKEPYES